MKKTNNIKLLLPVVGCDLFVGVCLCVAGGYTCCVRLLCWRHALSTSQKEVLWT